MQCKLTFNETKVTHQMGGDQNFFDPHLFPENYLQRLDSLKIFDPPLENGDPLMVFKAYFSFSLPFYVRFTQFLYISAYFHEGSDPLTPHQKKGQKRGQNFFSRDVRNLKWGVR